MESETCPPEIVSEILKVSLPIMLLIYSLTVRTERTCTTHSTKRYHFVRRRPHVDSKELIRKFCRNALAGWYRLIVTYALRKRLMDDGLNYAQQALTFLQSKPVSCEFSLQVAAAHSIL